jgi:hypothetical protein
MKIKTTEDRDELVQKLVKDLLSPGGWVYPLKDKGATGWIWELAAEIVDAGWVKGPPVFFKWVL